MANDIHLFYRIPAVDEVDGSRSKTVPYHRVPNTYFGSINGFEEYEIFVFFPRLYYQDRPSNYLTNDQLERFFGVVLNTIINSQDYDSTYLQHLPTSIKQAVAASYAKSRETGCTFASVLNKQQAIHYYLPAQGLSNLSNALAHEILENKFFDLSDFVFLISAKNLKTMF